MVAAAGNPQDELREQLAQAGKALEESPLTETIDKCVVVAMESVAENFDSSATAGGQAWAERKYLGDGHPLLIDTGRMGSAALGPNVGLSTLARPNGEGQGEHIREIEGREATVGLRTPYAQYHMDGTSRMPARPFFEVDGEAADKMADVVADDCLKLVSDILGAT